MLAYYYSDGGYNSTPYGNGASGQTGVCVGASDGSLISLFLRLVHVDRGMCGKRVEVRFGIIRLVGETDMLNCSGGGIEEAIVDRGRSLPLVTVNAIVLYWELLPCEVASFVVGKFLYIVNSRVERELPGRCCYCCNGSIHIQQEDQVRNSHSFSCVAEENWVNSA